MVLVRSREGDRSGRRRHPHIEAETLANASIPLHVSAARRPATNKPAFVPARKSAWHNTSNMLDWLSGKPPGDNDSKHPGCTKQSQQALTAAADAHNEPPETPAHLFAVKAFKSALFGTPAPPDFDVPEDEHDRSLRHRSGRDTTLTRVLPAPSPAKGILLTPGTIGVKRKTVSFGALNQLRDAVPEESQTNLAAIKQLETSRDSRLTIQRDVRRSLFRERQTKATTAIRSDSDGKLESQEEEDVGEDLTTDLQHPRSTSGKHWMEAYHRDHNMSKAEMKKLIKYSQMSKDHAARRDREASRLKEKLHKSEDRAKELEEKVRRLEQIPIGRQPAGHTVGESSTGRTSQDPQLTQLQKVSRDALQKAARLERENDTFKNTILRVKEEMAKYESRHKEWVAQRKRKDDRHADQRDALREKIVLQKTQYTELLRQSEERAEREKRSLLKEIDFLRGEVTSASPAKFALPALSAPKIDEPELKNNCHGNTGKGLRTKQLQAQEQTLEGGSSPTILDHHLAKARGRGSKSSIKNDHALPQITAIRHKPRQQSSRPTLITLDPEKPDEADDMPPVSLPANKNPRPAARARKSVRVVKPRPGLNGRSASGLPPDREAAARMRIAQRSAEKQRDTRFFFEEGKENRKPLANRLANV